MDEIIEHLHQAFLRGIARHFPEFATPTAKDHPSMKKLAESLGTSTYVPQGLLARRRVDYQVSTLFLIADWVGEPLETILGISERTEHARAARRRRMPAKSSSTPEPVEAIGFDEAG